MTAKHSRHIALTEPLARYLDDEVAKGQYASASEMVRTALRLLMERDKPALQATSVAVHRNQR